MVEYGLYMKHCRVEVYLLELKLCVHPYLNDIKERELSRGDTVGEYIVFQDNVSVCKDSIVHVII